MNNKLEPGTYGVIFTNRPYRVEMAGTSLRKQWVYCRGHQLLNLQKPPCDFHFVQESVQNKIFEILNFRFVIC